MDYDAWAEWYDVFYSTVGVEDVEFYVGLAQASGGPVLEIGCGTGRVSLPIAAAGIDVVGVDVSTAMLTKARERAATTKNHSGAVEFVQGDMRTLALDRRFPLVIIPARTLYLALTPEEQLESLRRAAAHLAPRGALAFNLGFRSDRGRVRGADLDGRDNPSRDRIAMPAERGKSTRSGRSNDPQHPDG